MYLSKLGKEQKDLFLQIAYHFVYADGVYSEYEHQEMIAYCNEMGIENNEVQPRNESEIFEKAKRICSKADGKIIIFELIGLGMVDGIFDVDERKFIKIFTEMLGITDEYCNECEKAIQEYLRIQEKFNNLVIA